MALTRQLTRNPVAWPVVGPQSLGFPWDNVRTGLQSPPTAPTISGTLTIGGTLTITNGAGGGPVTSYRMYRFGVDSGTVTNGYTYVAADMGDFQVVSVGPSGTSPLSNKLTFSIGGSPTLLLQEGGFVVTNGKISTWSDGSGGGLDFTQASAANRPLIGDMLGGHAVARGDGSLVNMNPAAALALSTLRTATTSFVLAVVQDAGGNADVVTAATFYNGNGWLGCGGGYWVHGKGVIGGVHSYFYGEYGSAGAAAVVATPSGGAADGWRLWQTRRAGTTLGLKIDAGAEATATASGNFGGTGQTPYLWINNNSASQYWTGDLAFLAIWSATPSAGVQADARAYLTNVYGVPS